MQQRLNIASTILELYQRQHARAGYVIPASVIVALSEQRGWSADEVVGGINYGCAEGWFADARNKFLRLTEDGFALIENSPQRHYAA